MIKDRVNIVWRRDECHHTHYYDDAYDTAQTAQLKPGNVGKLKKR
jgi:hypothetical protein